jgi:hypothetical protein
VVAKNMMENRVEGRDKSTTILYFEDTSLFLNFEG